jgi:hypothetical protein
VKKLIYIFLTVLIVACSSSSSSSSGGSNSNNSIVGNWQISDCPGCDFNDENADFYECFLEARFEFFDDLPGSLQEGWWYQAYLDNNGNCIVADEDDENSILLKWENTTDNNYLIYFKYVDYNELWLNATLNGNTLEFRNLDDNELVLVLSRL